MSQRAMLLVAVGLTAFVLVVVGALVSGQFVLTPMPSASQDQAAGVDPNAQPAPLGRSDGQTEPANRSQPPIPDQAQAPAQSADNGYPVTPEQATQAAQALLPGAQLLVAPELVDAQGVVAYEVRLDQGTLYVDASSGAVLNAPAIGARPQEGERHGHRHHDEDDFEHFGDEEGGEHDD